MKNTSGKNYLFLIIICIISCLVYLGFEYYFTDGRMGVPLDDTWIHFRFADNFSKGYFFQYNINELTAGTTSPLYVIVLGTASFIIKNFIINSILISFSFFLLSVILCYKISLLLFKSDITPIKKEYTDFFSPESLALLCASLTAISGRFVWSALSGMETTMFTCFSLAGAYYHIINLKKNKFNFIPTLFFSLAVVSRPEGFLIYALYLFDTLFNGLRNKSIKQIYLKLLLSVLIFSVISLPYLIFSYNLSGNFFPNTFRGQGGELKLIPDFNYLRIVVIYFFRDNLITGIIYLLSFIYYIFNIKKYAGEYRFVNLIMLWIFLLPLVCSLVIPNWRHHVRYMIPLIPFINIVSVYFLFQLSEMNIFSRLKKYIFKSRMLVSSLVVCSLVYYFVYAFALGKNTANINDQQVKLAEWVGKNVNRDETIAMNDIGAITFLNNNRIIDMAGLVTPEILKYYSYNTEDRLDSLNYLLKKNNVSYIIIYDHWFTEYLNKYGSDLTFITSARLEDNTICGGDEMKIYKTNFNNK